MPFSRVRKHLCACLQSFATGLPPGGTQSVVSDGGREQSPAEGCDAGLPDCLDSLGNTTSSLLDSQGDLCC